MKRWIHVASDAERYLANQYTSDNNFGDPGYAEAQSDEEDYSRVESLGWNDAEGNLPKKNYKAFCQACAAHGINCNQRWFKVYENAYNSAAKTAGRSVDSATDVYGSDWRDDPYADLYVVKIWYEVEPSGDTAYGPEAGEEIIQTVATSPQEAIEYAKRAWNGPIDRIEIVDINPEIEEDQELPFDVSINTSTNVTASNNSLDKTIAKWYTYDAYPDVDPARIDAVKNIRWDIAPEDVEIFLNEVVNFPDLTKIDYVCYFDENQDNWAQNNGYEGGYNIIFSDGSERNYAWLPYPHNLDPLEEVTSDLQ